MLRKSRRNKRKRKSLSRPNNLHQLSKKKINKNYWYLFAIALILTSIIIFWDNIFLKHINIASDADRDTSIHSSINIKVIKENESPIHYTVKPKECFLHYDKRQNAKDGGSRTTL